MRRRIFNILSALSLVLCVAIVVLWVRSYQADDCLTMRAPSNHQGYTQVMMDSGAGSVTIDFTNRNQQPVRLGYRHFDTLAVHYPSSAWGFGYSHQQGDMAIWMPHWVLGLSTAVLPLLWLNSHLERRRRTKRGLCQKCGYDLRASKERCPECGTAIVGPREG